MHRHFIQRLHHLLSLLVIVSLLIPAGLVVAQEGGTETPVPTDTAAPTETATPEATATPTETPTAVPAEFVASAPTEPAPVAPSRGGNGDPRLSSALGDLAEAYQVGGAAAALGMAETQGLSLQASGENVQVVAMLASGRTANEARDLIASLGGVVEVDIDSMVQISMPLNNLQALAVSGVFAGVRLPAYAQELAVFTEGKNASNSNAEAWHAVGLTGKGVKVAVIDTGFNGYTTLYGTELPVSTKIHARSFRADGSLAIGSHGRKVAEIVYDMAPDAEMWLVSFNTELEFVEAMDWLIAQNVDIVIAAVGWPNYDDGDGDSNAGSQNVLVDAVNRSYNAGILYVGGAGNSGFGHAQMAYADNFSTTIPAIDPAVQHYHEWAAGDVFNNITNWGTVCPSGSSCFIQASLAWSDWSGTNGQDYDLYILQSLDGGVTWTVAASSQNDQAQGYPWPTETAGADIPGDAQAAIVVHQFNNTAGGDHLELFTNDWDLQVDNPASSLLAPADAANAFAVGAYNHYTTSFETTSSQGPINGPGGASGGSAVKPDITGPDCVTTSLDSGALGDSVESCGTSIAAAHVAGAAALVWQANPSFTNAQVRSFLEGKADDLDGGLGGVNDGVKDNSFGWGRLRLGAAPAGPAACPSCINSAGWPLFQNAQPRTGLGASAVPATPSLLWTSPALTADVRSVVVGSGALAYIKAGRYVYGLNKDFGTVTWTFDLGALGAAKGPGAPALTDGGSPAVFVGSGDGYAYKIDANTGLQVCKSAKLGTDLSKASPMIGADGTVYFVDDTAAVDRLIAVNPGDCSQRWAVNLGAGAGTSSPTYWANPATADTNDDLIFVGADKLYAFTIWGGLKWSVSLKTAPEVTTTVPSTPVVIDPSGTWKVYAVNNVGDLYEVTNLTTTGTALRVADSPAGAHASGSLAAYKHNATDFYLYWGHLATLWRYNTAGGPATSLLLAGSLTDASPVVDSAGNLFIGSTDGKVYGINGGTMLDLDGAGTVWPKIAAISTAGGLAILSSELYVPSTDDRLRKYGALPGACTGCNTDSLAEWPTFQHLTNRNGNSSYTVGASPVQLWNRAPGGDVFPPIVGETGLPGYAQGITYFVTGRYLRALDIDTRNVIWSYDLGVAGTAAGFAAPALANQDAGTTGFANGIVYVGAKDGFLHAVNALTSARLWATDVGLDISKASPLIDDNGIVYVVEDAAIDRLIAVSHEGAVKWAANIGAAAGTSSPAYDGTCVFVGGNRLYGFKTVPAVSNIAEPCTGWDAAGYPLSVAPVSPPTALAPATTVPSAPMIIGTDIYALNNLGHLFKLPLAGGIVLDRNGVPAANRLYSAGVGAGSGSLAYDAGGANQYIYWTLGGKLYRHKTNDGTTASFTLSGVTTNSTPVIDAGGNTFVGTSDNKLWRLVRDASAPPAVGELTVIYTALGSMASAGAITTDGTNGVLLWPSLDDKLYAFGTPEGNCAGCDLAATQWPAFQRNAAHVPGELGGGGANIRKTRQFMAAGATRPAVADASNIYFVAGQNLYARNKNTDAFAWGMVGGVEKKYNLGLAVTAGFYAMPALAADGATTIIYVGGADGNLHAVNAATGDLIWKTDVGNNISKASPIVSAGGFIFVVEDNATPDRLIALDSTGTIVWSQLIGLSNGTSSPAIDVKTPGITDDVVLVGGGNGLYVFDLEDGSSFFQTNYGVVAPASPLTNGSPVVFDSATNNALDGYYVVSRDGVLWQVSFDGLTITNTNLGDADGALLKGGKSAAPFVVDNGGVVDVFFGLGNKLYHVTYDGATAPDPATSTTLGGDLGDSTPLAGNSTPPADGYIYIGSTDMKFYSVNQVTPPLTATAVFTHTASLAGSGAFMDADRVVWPAQDGKQLVFTDGSGALGSLNNATGQWPLFQLNPTHTGTAGVGLSVSSIEQWAVLTAGDVRGPVIGDATLWANYPDGVAYFVAGRYLYALDVATRLITKQWDLGATSGVSGYSAPAVIKVDGVNPEEWVFVADKLGVVRAYGFRWNGAAYEWVTNPTWSVDVGLDASKASVLAGFNDLVYVVEDTLAADRLHAINRANGSLLWSANLGASAGSSSPAFYDDLGNGVIYVGADKLYAIDALTGDPETGSPITLFTPAPGLVNSAPLIIGTDVYVLTTTARLFKVDATANTVTAQLIIDTQILTTIGAASMAHDSTNNYIVFGSANKLYYYGITGATLTPVTFGTLASNFTNSTPLVDLNGNAFIGGADGFLYGVDGSTLTAFAGPYNPVDGSGWPKKLGVGTAASGAAGSLAMDDGGNLYVPSLDDNLRRFGPAPNPPVDCPDCNLYTDAQWPMFQHDVAHTGRNGNGAGHRAPITLWSKATTTTSAPQRTPVLGSVKTGFANGILYYTSGQFVYARDAANGNPVWATPFDLGLLGNPSGGASPALLLAAANGVGVDDDTVYVIVGAKDGFLYALNANTGAMVWRIDLGLDISKASPVIDGEGTIYVVEDTAANDRLHAVYYNGTRKWTRDLAAGTGASSPLLDVTNTNVIVGSANKVFAFNTTSNASAWTTTMPAGNFNTSPMLSGDDLWALNNAGGLYRLNPVNGMVTDGGVAVGVQPMVAGVGVVGDGVAPAIQSDPYNVGFDIIAFTAGTRVYRVVWNNTTNLVVPTATPYMPVAGTVGNASPVIDANGWVYTLDSLGYLRAFYRYSFMPVFAKKVATQGTLAGGPIIGNGTNGTAGVYVPSRNNTFYKVGKP